MILNRSVIRANKDEIANNQNLSVTVYGIPASVTPAHLLGHVVDITFTVASLPLIVDMREAHICKIQADFHNAWTIIVCVFRPQM